MSNTMLIDGNSIGFANHQSNKLTYDGKQVQAIFGFIKSLEKLMKDFPNYKPVVLWDGHSFRYDIYPDYKGNRKDPKIEMMKDEYKKQKPIIQNFLNLMGVTQILVDNYEADDLAAIYSKKLSQLGFVVLVSGDKDWIQCINSNCYWFDPIKNRDCKLSNLFEFTGCRTVNEFVEKKCLSGDTSDNIKGVGGIGEARAEKLLSEYGSVEKFLSSESLGDKTPKPFVDFYENTKGGKEIFDRNKKLMSLINVDRPKPCSPKISTSKPNWEEFEDMCGRYGFVTVRQKIQEYKMLFGE